MIGYYDLKKKLMNLEIARENPISVDLFHKCVHESDSLEDAHKKYIESGGVYEEYSFAISPPTLYPIPNSYDNSTIDKEQIGFEGEIDPAIRQQALRLGKIKKPSQSVVYLDMKKEVVIIDKSELEDYVKRGYKIIYEEANVSPVGGRGATGFADTKGSFDKIASSDTMLFGKNKKELKKFKGKVFELPNDIFKRLKEGHPRFSRWSDYIQEDGDANHIDSIKNYSLRNPRSPVVIRNEETGEMAIMRRRTNDHRLKHNRSK
tara:strand:- start:138 stop:923 length:786 start_codon:yes stop_codon:yes gene_type:complete